MKTLVIQSFRKTDVPPWIGRCLASVAAWAQLRGYHYRLVGDEAFALCGAEYLAKVNGNLRAITNLARLELVRLAHEEGYDLAVWVDADILIFRPQELAVDHVRRYAFARETWISFHGPDFGVAFSNVNNSVFACRRGEPDLPFLIETTRHIARHREITNNFQVGGDIIKGLRRSLAFEMLDDVGMFSNHVVRGLARNESAPLKLQARLHGSPVYAANICASENYRPPVTGVEAMAAVEVLERTGGDVINRWLTGEPGLEPGSTLPFNLASMPRRALRRARRAATWLPRVFARTLVPGHE
jgi:hypothetical protein